MIEISILMNELCYEYSCEIKKMLEKGKWEEFKLKNKIKFVIEYE